MSLSEGAIAEIHNAETPDANPKDPRLQVLQIKRIANNNQDPTKPDRYRLHLSDGINKQPSAMLATQLNHLITENKITQFSIIRLDRYICNTVSDHRIIIILGASVVSTDEKHQLGDPQTMDAKKGATAPAATTPAPAPVRAAPQAGNPYNKGRGAGSYGASSNAGPQGGRGGSDLFNPITSLNPYNNRWRIKVRITKKTERAYRNAKGEGKILSVDMLDDSGELRGTAFNETADKLNPIFEQGKCYIVSGGRLKQANKKFTHIKNDYELTFGHETQVQEVQDESDAPQIKYDYVDFATLEQMNKEDAFCDVLAVVVEKGECVTFTTKAGKELVKREIQLMDKSQIVVRCTLWAKEAEVWNEPEGTIISVKAARLSDFGGCSMSVSNSSSMEINPDSEGAHELSQWYESEGKAGGKIQISNSTVSRGNDRRIFIGQIKDENLGMGEKPDYFITKGTISFVRRSDSMIYKACGNPNGQCNKKVIEEGDNEYRCEKCNRTFDKFNYRLIPSFSILDATGQSWLSAFNETAEKIFERTSAEMGDMRESNEAAYDNVIQNAYFKQFMFKCRAKADTYNDETRVKVSVAGVFDIDPVEESKYLIGEIEKYLD